MGGTHNDMIRGVCNRRWVGPEQTPCVRAATTAGRDELIVLETTWWLGCGWWFPIRSRRMERAGRCTRRGRRSNVAIFDHKVGKSACQSVSDVVGVRVTRWGPCRKSKGVSCVTRRVSACRRAKSDTLCHCGRWGVSSVSLGQTVGGLWDNTQLPAADTVDL